MKIFVNLTTENGVFTETQTFIAAPLQWSTSHQQGTLTCGEKEAHDELLTAVFVLAESLDKLSKKKTCGTQRLDDS